ncbi:MAG: gapB [Candidatus Paceibacter sp.]|jgi:glyceraldehyde 3-phosphate dehydrogenase|nr:gapB [Candidatus Paceibacter sp.]
MKKLRVAINGAGRIGRAFYRVSLEHPDALEVVALNDLGDINNIAYLMRYDTAYGPSGMDVVVKNQTTLSINGKDVAYLSVKDPATLPWKDMNIDVVVESTGLFTAYEKAMAHVTAGAKKVVISAPVKDEPTGDIKGGTFLMGINEDLIPNAQVSSNASCTTNAGSPIIAILHETLGIEKAMLNTVHGYTASQGIVDGPNKKDFREGRAAAQNIVPSSTGAAIAVTKVLPDLVGKFDGISIRVPVVVGSIVDITFISKKNTTAEEVNKILKEAAKTDRWKKSFAVTEEPLVSSDIIGNSHASIADLAMTRVVDGNLVKVLGWYDNEMGYTHTLVEHVIRAGESL